MKPASKILIINESPLFVRFVGNVIAQSHPYAVLLSARRGREGEHLAKLEIPDLILLDHILPDAKAESVAMSLLEDPKTTGTPIILTHRAAVDVNLSNDQLVNIVQLLPKPFTPEELLAAVEPLLEKMHELRRPNAQQKPKARARISTPKKPNGANPSVLFRGRIDSFPLAAALGAIEDDKLTGVLRLFTGDEPTEVYFDAGRIVLTTTRDTADYTEQGINGETAGIFPSKVIAQASKIQQETGCPFYLSLAAHKILPWLQAVRETQQQGLKLFSRVWENDKAAYEFEMLSKLPEFVSKLPAYSDSTYQWALVSMRSLDSGNQRQGPRRLDAQGVPAYTPEGYELIQCLKLTEVEAAFASAVDNARTVDDIARLTSIPIRQAQRELQKFVLLQVMDYWSPAVLSGVA
jgi:CheY-like chemotaxis protein